MSFFTCRGGGEAAVKQPVFRERDTYTESSAQGARPVSEIQSHICESVWKNDNKKMQCVVLG